MTAVWFETSSGQSAIHRLDARAKIALAVTLLLLSVSTPAGAWTAFAGYAVFLAGAQAWARVSFARVWRRVRPALPFIILLALCLVMGELLQPGRWADSRDTLRVLLVKCALAVWTMSLLGCTTGWPQLLEGLARLGVPRMLVMLAGFTARYVALFSAEAARMKRARDSRGYRGRWIWQAQTLGHMLGTLFLRSFERGERVYLAMVARGFDGGAHGYLAAHAPLSTRECVCAVFTGLLLVGVRLFLNG